MGENEGHNKRKLGTIGNFLSFSDGHRWKSWYARAELVGNGCGGTSIDIRTIKPKKK